MASVEHKTWTYGDGAARTYLCSTDPGLLQLDALNAALGSDMLWWAKALPEDRLQTLINNCLIIGLYSLDPENSGQPIKDQKRTMIGAARLITDRVTFGYLTDVYVLEEHQQRGLGKFLMKCLNEIVEGWPELRALWILASSPESQKLYAKIFDAQDFFATNKNPNLKLLEKKGPESSH
ncbi:hypothetical protein SLS64_008944 [Diaporthe eres]|uniref:N-acetyltransferase domain-containing protein n=1 Tax=Diaporthe eres TaxID=83184 RepID=A0ABR1NST4_DIAER